MEQIRHGSTSDTEHLEYDAELDLEARVVTKITALIMRRMIENRDRHAEAIKKEDKQKAHDLSAVHDELNYLKDQIFHGEYNKRQF